MTERTDLNSPTVTESRAELEQSFASATSKTAAVAPDVFVYDDYRRYLSDWLRWKKSMQPHYSGAIFAKKAGLNSHTLLGMVMRGQRNLSPTSIRCFCRALSLKGKEGTFFEKLVLLNQAKNPEDRAYYLEQLTAVTSDTSSEAMTVAVPAADIERIMARIREFGKQLQAEYQANGTAERFVAINAQVASSAMAAMPGTVRAAE
jgi:hypothetical protein